MNIKHFELVKIAEEFLQNYNLKLDVPIEFNTRLKNILGRVLYIKKQGEHIPQKIEMSIDFIRNHPKEHITDVFKHELVHYAMCVQGLPFNDGDKHFEDELKKYGIKSTHSYSYLGELHRYTCENCGNKIERKRKLVKTAYCGCSKGPNLIYNGIFQKDLVLGNMVAMTAAVGQGVCHSREDDDDGTLR